MYGLVDASRNWFLSVKKELGRLKCEQSKLDPALFYWHKDNKLEGLFLMYHPGQPVTLSSEVRGSRR